ncbi:hypothetical protein K1719_041057 [Acacia pycnantha]|nr:hypothetical protein K1719_041057 [Acacia pycnantha]
MTSSMKMVTLRSNDDEEFDIPMNVASQSELVKNLLIDVGDTKVVLIDNVNAATLAKVIEYCKKHADESTAEDGEAANDAGGAEELERWEAEFVKLDNSLLFEILLAANYMDIKNLFDLICRAIADKMKNKTPEQIRRIFNLENDFTPEEEAKFRKDNPWAFEVKEED